MKTQSLAIAIIAALTSLTTLSTASAQQRIQIAPPLPGPPAAQPASYFLGVYTTTVRLPGFGGPIGPVGPVAAAQPRVQIRPRIVPQPGPAPQAYGQRVDRVVPGSPAARAGLEPGDILVTGNQRPLTCKQALVSAINQSGGHLRLTVINVRTGYAEPLATYPQYQGGPVFTARR